MYALDLTGFNRTFMELKCHFVAKVVAAQARFNRTFMELKLGYGHGQENDQNGVLIVPLWN